MSFIRSLVILLSLLILTEGSSFVYNGFRNSTLKLGGSARVLKSGILQITNKTQIVVGHAFHPAPIRLKTPQNGTFSFSTTFVFSIRPEYPGQGGHGFAFAVTPFPDLPGAFPREYLGLLNSSSIGNKSNHLFAVEFDTVENASPFKESNGNHVGIDVNSLVSADSEDPGMDLKSGRNIQAWIEVRDAGSNHRVEVFVAFAGGAKPRRPLLSTAVDLRGVLEDDVYVGFSASTGLLSSEHWILGWSFASNGTAAAELDLEYVGSGESGDGRVFVTVLTVGFGMLGCVAVVVVFLVRRRFVRFDQWAECGPRKFTYGELKEATKNFKELLGSGGFGKVYRGVLSDGQEVAVKRVSQDSRQGLREFLAEIVTIGRLRHRNLMRLHGYCRHQRKSELLLVYDYMPNASLDKKLFYGNGLSWEQRYTILKGVAAALLYLHEEWEQQVIHRDVKASNVLLDGKLNARLGDFGLARLYDHGKNPQTTRAVGTLGYVAPEVMRTGKPTTSSDVYSYGSLLLETVCGRRPVEPCRCEEEMVLVEWVWSFQVHGEVLLATDPRLLRASGHNASMAEEIELVLKLGLLCLHVLPERRPSMRHVVQILNKDVSLPPLPPQMPTIEHPPPPLGFNYNLAKYVDL